MSKRIISAEFEHLIYPLETYHCQYLLKACLLRVRVFSELTASMHKIELF